MSRTGIYGLCFTLAVVAGSSSAPSSAQEIPSGSFSMTINPHEMALEACYLPARVLAPRSPAISAVR
jgi:hypothetical protein